MIRYDVVQQYIDKVGAKNYLEIGVKLGETFLKVKAPTKLGVDPHFRISLTAKIGAYMANSSNWNNQYFEMTSDHFFDTKQDLLDDTRIDIALVDGLHTYEQSFKDVKNVLKWLSPTGMIVMHDCNPATAAVAQRAQCPEEAAKRHPKDWNGDWCGDVWKAVLRLRSELEGYNMFVLDTDFGLGIITKGEPENKLNFSKTDVDDMSFEDLEKNREAFLNLKPASFFETFLASR